MPLTGKYLKYSPEITLEIFTLIWDKLIEHNYDGFSGVNTIFSNFKTYKCNVCIAKGTKIISNNFTSENLIETTVQEILGYDPFVKEGFVLPEKWCVRRTDENAQVFCDYYNEIKGVVTWYPDRIKHNDWIISRGIIGSTSDNENYTEITFDQFKKYVLKSIETPKEVIPKYVECIEDIYGLEIGKIYHVDNNIIKDGHYNNYSIINNTKIKPSTKEAFDAQSKPKIIEKWSVGSYVVFLQDYGYSKKGSVDKIIISEDDGITCKNEGLATQDIGWIEWFATKVEAEKFAETLKLKKLLSLNQWYQSGNHIVYLYERNKVYGFHHDKWFTSDGFSENDLKYISSCTVEEKFTKYIKDNYSIGKSFIDLVNKLDFQIKNYILNFSNNTTQIYIPVEPNEVRNNKTARIFDKGIWANYSSTKSNKQAVHCKTQEEWDFVTEKLSYKWSEGYWGKYGENTCIEIGSIGYGTSDIAYKDYQILSFQEWCDLNGYKMENKCELEVDKWYKLSSGKSKLTNPNWYIKYKECEDNIIYASEYINDKTIYVGGYRSNFGKIDEYKFTLINVVEIQQYLPDNHPEKILEFSKANEFNPYNFKVGDYLYVLREGYKGDILEITGIKPEYPFNASWINHNNDSFTGGGFRFSKTCHPYGVDVRLATKEEVQNYKDREVFKSYNLDSVKLGNNIHEAFSHLKTVNPCSEVLIKQAIGRLDRSLSIFPTFEEKPSIKITEFEITRDYFINFKDPYN